MYNNQNITIMKKSFMLFVNCICAITIFAQIGPVQTEEKKYETIKIMGTYSIIHYDKITHKFTLPIFSDNEFESKYAILPLGVGEEEAINSLVNFKKAMQNIDEEYVIAGYDF